MNRLAPLIVRRVGPYAAGFQSSATQAQARAVDRSLDDLKLFATVWLGGLVFFGTYLG